MKIALILALALLGLSSTFGQEAAAPVPADTAVTGTVFLDSDGDTAQTEGDSGVAGATVRLIDDEGNEVYITTTGEDGSYTFPDVAPGTYTVQIIFPSGRVVPGGTVTKAAGNAAVALFPLSQEQVFPGIPVSTGVKAAQTIPQQNANPGNVRGEEVSTFAP